MGDQPLDRQTSRLSLREQLGSRLQSFRASRGKERKRSQDDAVSAAPKGPEVMSPRSRAALARSKQEALDALPADYYQPDYDPVAGELAMLPRMFTEGDLEAVVEERSGVLETVSERLSQHVLSNYSKFVAGVTEVASVERDLQEAYRTAKTSRSELANALAEVRANMVITRKQKQKQGLERMLGTLQQLREAAHLHDALRAAQENGEFAGSFWLCAQCARALAPLSYLLVAPELTATVTALYEETVARLESSLQTVCADFQPDPYAKVLEGYVYLGNVGSLGEEVMAAFAAVVGAAALKVARGVVLTRPTPGLEERVKSTHLLQELVKWVPADLFRTCLTRVLMVVFEILASHYHMSRWHEERIDQHTHDMEALHSAGTALRERIDALVKERATSPTLADSPTASERAGASAKGGGHFQEAAEDEDVDAAGSIAAVVERSLQRAVQSKAEGLPKAESTEQPSGSREVDDTKADVPAHEERDVGATIAAQRSSLAANSSSVSLASLASRGVDEERGEQPSGGNVEADLNRGAGKAGSPAAENGNEQPQAQDSAAAVSTSSKVDDKGGGRGAKKKTPADAKALEIEYLEGELEALAEKEREEVLWGEALMQVEEGLNAGRRWLWDEASRKVGMLLAAPAAFQGEHFLQVLEWTQTMLEAGEAFCGSQSATLRDALKRQSGRFFAAYHSANLQALHSMLEREVWKQLPMIPGGLPSIRGALTSPSPNAAFPFDTSNFGAWVSHGNPWRSQAYEDEDEEAEGQRTPGQALEGGPGDAAVNPASEATAATVNGAAAGAREAAAQPAADDAVARSTASASTSGRGTAEAVPLMTTSSLRLAKWLAEYAALMRLIGSEAGRVWSGMAELFELYFLHTFHTFGDITILELTSPQVQRQGGADIVPVRLKNAVLRILSRSKYRQYYLQQPPGAAGTPGAGNAPGGAASPGGPSQGAVAQYGGVTPTKDYSPFGRLPSAAQPAAMSPQSTAFSHPGNMYGLMERKVAVDSLRSVAGLLSEAYSALHDSVFGRTDVPENHTLDTFFSTVKATADLRDMVLRAAARYNLPIRWLPDRLAEQNFNIEEPPTRASPWVKVLMGHAAKLRQCLDASPGLTPANVAELWRHAMHFTAEVVLEGIAKAGAKAKCTAMGRAAMSLDLQAVQKGLADLAGPGGAEAAADSLRMVDTYIKAFYLPWGEELRRWAQTHPEYTRNQIMMLTVCIAEANGLKRKERNAFLSQLEADLSDLRAVP